jgi:arylsulfatase A-like enzyme
MHTYVSRLIEKQEDRNRFLKGEIAKLEKEIAEINSLRDQIQAPMSRHSKPRLPVPMNAHCQPYFTASHGTIHEYDTHVPLIFLGGAFKPGHNKALVTPADIAPTLADIAGITLSHAQGTVLRSARN